MAKSKFPSEYIKGCTEKVYEVLRDESQHSDWTQIGISIQQALQAAANYVQRVTNDDERIDCLYKIFREICLIECRNISDNNIHVIPKPDWNQILYCPKCGSVHVVERYWKDVNTGDCANNATEYYCSDCHEYLEEPITIRELWDSFDNISIDDDDCIEESFLEFEPGDSKYAVWRWFNKRCPNGLKDLGFDIPSDILKQL